MPRVIVIALFFLALALTAVFDGARAQTGGFTPPLRGAPEGRTGGASRDIGAGEATRVALVIGNGGYQYLPRLDNPTNDAQLMAATLKSLGFELIGGGAATNLDRAGFEKAIREFGAKLNGSAVGLFYYAGHGVQVQGGNYLVPVGANPTNTADVDFELINAELVLRQMETAGSKLNIVILDACRNNPFGGRGLRASGGGLAQMQAPQGTLISYATQPGNVALDGANGHSPYTQALADELRQPGERVLDVFNAVGLAAILERLADTLIGAAIAHLFNYVWPRWESSEAPRIASRLQAQLAAFAALALRADAPEHDYRLARKNLIEAIAALSDSAGRMSIEPVAARKGLEEMAALLIAAHGLVAQLSAARLAARTGAPAPDEATRQWLQTRLASEPDADNAPPGPLAAAALGLTAAARNYRRVAKSEAR